MYNHCFGYTHRSRNLLSMMSVVVRQSQHRYALRQYRHALALPVPPLPSIVFVLFSCLQLGNLDAPVGSVAIVFLYVVGASALIADLGYIATRALDTFQVRC